MNNTGIIKQLLGLTRRESEIANLISKGLAKKQVADKLKISSRTVENTARNIYSKVGINSNVQLCLWVLGKQITLPKEFAAIFTTFLIALMVCLEVESINTDKIRRLPGKYVAGKVKLLRTKRPGDAQFAIAI